MKIAKIQFAPWDKVYHFDTNNIEVVKGNKVLVKTSMGMEIGDIVGFVESNGEKIGCGCSNNGDCPHKNGECNKNELKPIIRIANELDLEKIPSQKVKDDALKYCKEKIRQYKLEMKLVDVHFSYDNSRMTFVFIANSRVDFRELVKDLTRHFNKTIRLQQIGIRDEAKITGDYGHCGKKLCCKGFLNELESISSDMADLQQCAHRGSERISGVCGRLMCCLAYEQKSYEELEKKLPPIGARVNVDGKRGEVVGHHILKQSVNVKFPSDKGEEGSRIAEVDLNRNK